MTDVTKLTSKELGLRIAELQKIQMSCHCTAPKWQTASELLAPCFEEAAARQARGETVPSFDVEEDSELAFFKRGGIARNGGRV